MVQWLFGKGHRSIDLAIGWIVALLGLMVVGESSVFWTPSAAHRVAIRRADAPAIELRVPRGVYVSVCGIDAKARISLPHPTEPMPRLTIATGNLVLRMRPEREVHFTGSVPSDEIMATAPVVLALRGVTLTITTVLERE